MAAQIIITMNINIEIQVNPYPPENAKGQPQSVDTGTRILQSRRETSSSEDQKFRSQASAVETMTTMEMASRGIRESSEEENTSRRTSTADTLSIPDTGSTASRIEADFEDFVADEPRDDTLVNSDSSNTNSSALSAMEIPAVQRKSADVEFSNVPNQFGTSDASSTTGSTVVPAIEAYSSVKGLATKSEQDGHLNSNKPTEQRRNDATEAPSVSTLATGSASFGDLVEHVVDGLRPTFDVPSNEKQRSNGGSSSELPKASGATSEESG